jgi:hypothetical protein
MTVSMPGGGVCGVAVMEAVSVAADGAVGVAGLICAGAGVKGAGAVQATKRSMPSKRADICQMLA